MGRVQQSQSEVCSSQEDNEDGQKQQDVRRPHIERIDRIKNLKKIIINVSMTQYPVVSEVAEALGWKIQSSNEAGDWDIFWTDFSVDPDILIRMHLFQKINHFPGIHTIARKNLLGLNLMSMRVKFPQEYNFFPLTWMLPQQYAEFRAYFETKQKGKARTYIVKPEAECQGRGIFLTRKLEDLENGKHYVVQRYIARPYLIDGLKFDFRIYVLLCGTDPLRLYIYNEGLARLATQPYTQPSSTNLDQPYIHLTNYAINKNNPKFVFNSSSTNMSYGHKRALSCVYKQLEAKGVDIVHLKEQIKDISIKTIISGLPLMSHQYRCSQPEDYSGNMCFHILGLDIMMNEKGEPSLIEVNHTPSFTTDTPLDSKIKHNLIKDSLILMNISADQKQQLYNRSKQINRQRLLTGKRHIFDGAERQKLIEKAQKDRDAFEDAHLGGYERIFPTKCQETNQRYKKMIEAANKGYLEDSSPIRAKLIEKEAMKLRSRAKKDPETAQKESLAMVTSELIELNSGVINEQDLSEVTNLCSSMRLPCTSLEDQPRTNTIRNRTKIPQQVLQSNECIDVNSDLAAKIQLELLRKSEANRHPITSKASLKLRPNETSMEAANRTKAVSLIPTKQRPVVVIKQGNPESLLLSLAQKMSRRLGPMPQMIEGEKISTTTRAEKRQRQEVQSTNIKRKVNSEPRAVRVPESSTMDKVSRKIQLDLISNPNSGGYVMPRLFCLNLTQERRGEIQQGGQVRRVYDCTGG